MIQSIEQALNMMKETLSQLFAAWSSGDIDAPGAFVTEDFRLCDTAFDQECKGWPAAREFFAYALENNPGVHMRPTDIWCTDEENLALVRWVMTGSSAATGRLWEVEGVSTLRFRDGLVCEEIDYYTPAPIQAASTQA